MKFQKFQILATRAEVFNTDLKKLRVRISFSTELNRHFFTRTRGEGGTYIQPYDILPSIPSFQAIFFQDQSFQACNSRAIRFNHYYVIIIINIKILNFAYLAQVFADFS